MHKPMTEWGSGLRPVHDVSWNDITNDFLPWLNRRLGLSGVHGYRLLSGAEWEYCCRAGTKTAYSFGDMITIQQAQFSEGVFGSADQSVVVGRFPSNACGLHDMHGNVWEWYQDVFQKNYAYAPDDGSANDFASKDQAVRRVIRGGSWLNPPKILRSGSRLRYQPDYRLDYCGCRLARTLNP